MSGQTYSGTPARIGAYDGTMKRSKSKKKRRPMGIVERVRKR